MQLSLASTEMSWYSIMGCGEKGIPMPKAYPLEDAENCSLYLNKKWPQTPFLANFFLFFCLDKQTTTLIINPSQTCTNPTAPDGGGRRRKSGWLLMASFHGDASTAAAGQVRAWEVGDWKGN